MSSTVQRSKAFYQGVQACRDADPLDRRDERMVEQNPYGSNGQDSVEWERGWIAARELDVMENCVDTTQCTYEQVDEYTRHEEEN